MTTRSEDDKITQAPIVVILGGEEYKIAPLVIRDSREWRKKVIKLVAPLPVLLDITTDDVEGFLEAMTQLLVIMPDEVGGLFFEYAKDLDKEEIEGKASDAELTDAFEEVMKIAFPLAKAAPAAMMRMLVVPEVKEAPEAESSRQEPPSSS